MKTIPADVLDRARRLSQRSPGRTVSVYAMRRLSPALEFFAYRFSLAASWTYTGFRGKRVAAFVDGLDAPRKETI